MAKTVDQFSTIEDFRLKHNELAIDVGDKSGLRTTNVSTVVDALNSLEDKSFYFQEFIYTATSSQTTFTGADAFSNVLKLRKNRIQVYKNTEHLLESVDYSLTTLAADGTYGSLLLNTGATTGDKIVIYAYTGSYLGVSAGDDVGGQFTETAIQTIYNTNTNGIILNGVGTPDHTSVLESGYTIQLNGATYGEENLTLASGKTLTSPTITDSTLSINSGNITAGVAGTFSGALTAGSFTDNTMTITGGDITGVDDITGTANSLFTALQFIDKSGANLTGGVLTAASIDISGNADIDGIMEADAYTVDGTALNEYISDTVGAMVSSNTESGISVTYEDSDNTIDFDVDDPTITFTGDVAGSGQIVNLGDVTIGLTIQPDSVALGTDTTGNYVSTIADAGNTHITVANSGTENAAVTLNIANDAVDSDQIAPNAVALGTQTTGNYMSGVTGTANEIEISHSAGEGSTATIGLPNDVTVAGQLTVNGNLDVNGTLTSIDSTNLSITDKLIVLGKGSTTLLQTDTAGIQLGEHADAPTLTWDNTNSRVSVNKSIYSTVGLGNDASALADINYTTTPAAGQALIWDNAQGYWEPTTLGSTTDSYTEGTNNKYFTDNRVADIMQGTHGTPYKSDGIVVEYDNNGDGGTNDSLDGEISLKLDYEVVSAAPTVVGSTSTGHLWFVI